MAWITGISSLVTLSALPFVVGFNLEKPGILLTESVLVGLGYGVFLMSGVAFTLKAYANDYLGVSIVSLYGPLQIAVATFLYWFSPNHAFYWNDAVGVLLCISGVLLVHASHHFGAIPVFSRWYQNLDDSMKIENVDDEATTDPILDSI